MRQKDWEIEKAIHILELVRTELYMDMPHFLTALNTLEFRADDRIATCATNGMYFYYNPLKIIDLFQKNSIFLNRAYLHSILHCLYNHIWLKKNRIDFIWNVACDIIVEYTLDSMHKKSISRILSYARKDVYSKLESLPGISCITVYEWLSTYEDIQNLYYEFVVDDHALWPKEQDEQMPMASSLQKKWQRVAKQTLFDHKQKGKDNEEGDAFLVAHLQAKKSKYSFAQFLKRFSIMKEELQINPDEFDLSYYTYGLSVYKNMPLMEPLETKEVKKIYEFVIALDTSYSIDEALAKRFVSNTYSILSTSNMFYKTCKVHIIQCDDRIRKDDVVSNQNEMDILLNSFTLVGGSNTDFRPVFSYVNDLIDGHAFQNLCGLLYFTDGKGIYPKKNPAYKTAFIYLDDYDQSKVPSWAIQYRLEEKL